MFWNQAIIKFLNTWFFVKLKKKVITTFITSLSIWAFFTIFNWACTTYLSIPIISFFTMLAIKLFSSVCLFDCKANWLMFNRSIFTMSKPLCTSFSISLWHPTSIAFVAEHIIGALFTMIVQISFTTSAFPFFHVPVHSIFTSITSIILVLINCVWTWNKSVSTVLKRFYAFIFFITRE